MSGTARDPRPRARLWGHRDFLRLWVGQSVSELGSQVSFIAIPLAAVSVLGAGAFQTGLLGALQFLPFLLIGLPAGVWVDRLAHRPVLIAADAGRLVVTASIPVAWAFGELHLAQLYVCGFAVGLLYLVTTFYRAVMRVWKLSESAAKITTSGIDGRAMTQAAICGGRLVCGLTHSCFRGGNTGLKHQRRSGESWGIYRHCVARIERHTADPAAHAAAGDDGCAGTGIRAKSGGAQSRAWAQHVSGPYYFRCKKSVFSGDYGCIPGRGVVA